MNKDCGARDIFLCSNRNGFFRTLDLVLQTQKGLITRSTNNPQKSLFATALLAFFFWRILSRRD